jgi:hypothetical protein
MKFANSVITFLRGDDDALIVGLANGAAFETGDIVHFCLRSNTTTEDDILQIDSSEFVTYEGTANAGALVNILHLHTTYLDTGTYYYTIWIEWTNGTYVTVVPPTKFILAPGGSHD